MEEHKGRRSLLYFLLGLVLGNKGIHAGWHIMYWLIMIAEVVYFVYVR